MESAIDIRPFYPTFRKSFAKPDEELAFKYVLTVIRYLFSLLVLEHYTVVSVYQFVSIFMELAIVIVLLWRRAVLKRQIAEQSGI